MLAARFLVREGGTPRPAFSILRRRRAAMGTVRREPIETAGRGVSTACVLSIFRRDFPPGGARLYPLAKLPAESGGRRRGEFCFGYSDLAIGAVGAGAELGGVRSRSWRDRAAQVAAFYLGFAFPRAREGGVSIRRRRRGVMGTVRREPIETR